MRKLTERTEIATVINFNKMPIVEIDLADATDYSIESKPVKIAFKDSFIKATIIAYTEETKFCFSGSATHISSSFGYSDVKEMLDYANAPTIHTDEDVCIVIINSKTKEAYEPIVLHTSKDLDAFCMTPLEFIDKDYDTKGYLELAGLKQELRN